MAGTTWHTMTRMEPKSWLLGNGEIVREPTLETTMAGRKIRVAGTKQSVYDYDIDQLLWDSVQILAAQKQTHVHIETTQPLKAIIAKTVGFEPAQTPAKLHLVHAAGERNAKTIVWWRFKDSKTPFEALLTLTMGSAGGVANPQRITALVTVPTRQYDHDDRTMIFAVNVNEHRWSTMLNQVARLTEHGSFDYEMAWEEFIRDNPPDWDSSLLGTEQCTTLRSACAELLKKVREFDGMDYIEVPDFGDPDNPSWRRLELYDTNYNQALVQDLADYLDGAPTVEQAAELYGQMLETLRACGIVIDGNLTSNDFQTALLNGDKAALGVRVFGLAETEHRTDDDHKLSIHLPTGTFIVECDHKEVSQTETAEKWEEALTMASLTGREDELLAFAKAYAKQHRKSRTKKILNERKA